MPHCGFLACAAAESGLSQAWNTEAEWVSAQSQSRTAGVLGCLGGRGVELWEVKESVSCLSVHVVKGPAEPPLSPWPADVRPSCSEGSADSSAAMLDANINFRVFNKS